MKHFSHIIAAMLLTVCSLTASASVANVKACGWFESGYVTWTKVAGCVYNVYVQDTTDGVWKQLDTELVREYPDYGRADALGLAAGQYKFKVVPVLNGTEQAADATESEVFTATTHDRGGFAHFATASSAFNPANGIGAYKNDGTLKAGAKVIYVTAENAKTIKTTVMADKLQEFTGFQNIINAYQKGKDKTPIAFRIIGTIYADNMDSFGSSAEGLQIKGKNAYSELNITIEGVGSDAAVHGFGFLLRNACSVELRNFAIMWCMDDAVSMDTDNSNIWLHNLDLFYGQAGSAADQAKGDGTLDVKGDSKYVTMSYNHFWDSGKSSLCGMTSESGPNYITYHHNWFDHSDSRHPRIRTMSVHVYNNYYDGNAKYGVGATTGSDVFVENNYFRNCKYPMLISKQGSDINNGVGSSSDTKGTFSGEEGGSIKAFGNHMTGHKRFQPYNAADATNSKHFDAYVVTSRDEKVPATVTALLGGDTYSNFDTDPSLMYSGYTLHSAEDVPATVMGTLGAGRCQKGDFSWTFADSEDSNSEVITELSNAIKAYKPTLTGFFGNAIDGGGEGGDNGGDTGEGGDDSGSTTPDSGNTGDIDATAVYKYTVKGSAAGAVVNGETQLYSEPIATQGGTFQFGNVSKIEASDKSASGFAVKLDGDAKSGNTKYVLVSLTAPLAKGDIITVTCYATSTPSNNYGASLYTNMGAAALATVYNTKKNTEESLTITVTDTMAGLSEFYVCRNTSKSVYLTGVTVSSTRTGLSAVKEDGKGTAATLYDLSGRKVKGTAKGGIYIQNGKKYAK